MSLTWFRNRGPRTWDLIRGHRDLRLLFVSNFFWSFGAMLYMFVWPNYVRDLGGGAWEIGFLSSLMFGTVAVTLVPGGWLADRWERKRLMLVTWGLATGAPLLFARAWSWAELIPGVLLYSVFLGWPAMEAYTADAVPPSRLAQAFTLTNAGYSLGAVASPLVGAGLWPSLGMRGLFVLAFGFFALSTLTLGLMRPQRPAVPAGGGAGKQSRSGLWSWTLLLVLASWGSSVVRPFLPTYLEDAFGWSRPWILAASSAIAFGEVVWAAPLGRLGDRHGGWAMAGALGTVALGLALLLAGSWGLAPALLFLGADRVGVSLLRSQIGREAGPRRGAVFGTTLVLANGAQALGPLAGSALYNLRPQCPLIVAGGLAAALALLALRIGRPTRCEES